MLQRLCRELAWEAAGLIADAMSSLRSRPASIVLGGGLAAMPGVIELVREASGRRCPPNSLGALRAADPSPFTLARGALIQAELDSQALRVSA